MELITPAPNTAMISPGCAGRKAHSLPGALSFEISAFLPSNRGLDSAINGCSRKLCGCFEGQLLCDIGRKADGRYKLGGASSIQAAGVVAPVMALKAL